MDTNRIHLLNGTRPVAKDSDLCTVKQVTEIMVATLGPLAALLREVCARQQAIEDHVGFVVPVMAPVNGEGVGNPEAETPPIPDARDSNAPPADGGDIEC